MVSSEAHAEAGSRNEIDRIRNCRDCSTLRTESQQLRGPGFCHVQSCSTSIDRSRRIGIAATGSSPRESLVRTGFVSAGCCGESTDLATSFFSRSGGMSHAKSNAARRWLETLTASKSDSTQSVKIRTDARPRLIDT